MNTSRREERRQGSRELVDLIGRVCAVTGATRGLGLATSTALAEMGATVIMLGRDRVRGESAAQWVREAAAPGAEVSFVSMDLASLASVCAAAAEIALQHDVIHVLVNNAGVNLRSRLMSSDGFEMTWAINHLGPFLFTNQLLPQLRAAKSARVVTVTSQFARFGRVSPRDIGTDRASTALRAYFDTKLANMLFTVEFARRLEGARVVANCVHPGIVATDLMREWPGWMRGTWEWALRTSESGAAPIVRLAVSPSVAGVSGQYFVRGRRAHFPRRARDPELARELWEESERLVGLVSS
jgi:NAD(P)-dependent dehydrogenase (short-subunit alcohol dehydrogenase family)